MNYKALLIALIISGYFACDDLEHTNPVDPNFVLEAPTNISVTVINDQSVRLNWDDNCKQEEGFVVECKIEGSAYAEIADLNANTETYTDTDLTYGKNYAYRVKAFTDRNESDYSNELQVEMIIPAPTNLKAIQIDDQSLRLSWIDNCTFESGFRIERNNGGGFTQIGEVTTDVTTYTDNGLIYGQTYTYRAKAFTDKNESDYSNESGAVEMIIPAPSNLSITVIDFQSVQLTWEDNCTFEIGYKVERMEDGNAFAIIADLSINTETYKDQGLTFGSDYTYRIQAHTNSNLSDYSEEVLTNINVAVDNDGNVYKVVKIGDQYWMAENLKVTHYRNGDAIPNVTDNYQWSYLTTGAYCNYNNSDYPDIVYNVTTYGRLYNWYAVSDSRLIAPEGWHVPTDEEWKDLEMYLGMSQSDAVGVGWRGTDEGSKLKSTSGWYNNGNGNNESGFSALPGGIRLYDGYYSIGSTTSFWSSTEHSSGTAWRRYLIDNNSGVYRFTNYKQDGFSVRCVRD